MARVVHDVVEINALRVFPVKIRDRQIKPAFSHRPRDQLITRVQIFAVRLTAFQQIGFRQLEGLIAHHAQREAYGQQ